MKEGWGLMTSVPSPKWAVQGLVVLEHPYASKHAETS